MKDAPKKSHKALIITLLAVFIITPFLFSITALAVLPSARLCSGLVRTGNETSELFTSDLELATYKYHCLGGTPPTAEDQYISLGLLSAAAYQSRAEFQTVISNELTSGGWSPVAASSETAPTEEVVFSKDGYKAKVTIQSYQPAHAVVILKPDAPKVNFGLVFEKSPELPATLSAEQEPTFVTVPIYTPEYTPAGYSEWRFNAKQTTDTKAVVTLQGGRGTVAPRLGVSALASGYDITAGREVFATTPTGIVIYKAAAGSAQGRYDLAAIVGTNLVTLEASNQHPNVNPQLTVDEISQVFGSLKQTNTPAQ